MAGARQPRKKKAAPSAADELRREAEERLDRLSADAADAASPVPEDVAAVVHDLRVHQIELEMQNEELRRVEIEMEASREKYFELFDLAPVGYLTLSDRTIIRDANLTAAHLLGVDRQGLVGQPFSAFILAADQDVFYLHQRRLQQTREPQTCELRLRRADPGAATSGGAAPDHFWAHLEGRPERAAPDEPFTHWVTFSDIDERVAAQQEIRRLNAGLEQRIVERTSDLEASLGEQESFSYSVSHDLRQPLRALDGFSKILIEDYGDRLDSHGRGHLERIRAAAQQMGLLIDGLLELARLNRADLRRRAVDVSMLAAEIAEELQVGDPQRSVTFEIAPGLVATADPDLTRVVLANLIGNAWKFTSTHETARIEVGADESEGERACFVRDDGVGFDMTYADKLFGAFQRLHSPGEFEGTGIGLATVQRIVHRHGGRVWAESEVEKGACFFFTLPEETTST